MKAKRGKRVKKVGVRAQILFGFVFFTFIIVALLWVLQISLLDNFYRYIKLNDTKENAVLIAENYGNIFVNNNYNSDDYSNNEAVQILQSLVVNDNTEILISDPQGNIDFTLESPFSRTFDNVTPSYLSAVYNQAKKSGGDLQSWYSTNSLYNRSTEEVLIYATAVQLEDGSNKLILLQTVVTPVTATVDALSFQLYWVTIAMLLLSSMIAYFVSIRISRPIVAINDTAKNLARGKYDIVFPSHGSAEIKELSHTLNVVSYELSRVDELRKELIANVSHDLRTPLTMISGYGEVMRDIPGENNAENIQIIIDEAERLKNLVNDLLDISKLEAGQIDVTMEPVNLTKSIVNIIRRYDKLADFNFDFYHGNDINVMGDELKLSQVVYNLLNNAINYTGEDKRIVLKQTTEGNYVKIEVIDTGEGIPSDKINEIWERYYKIDKTHKRAVVGTGLGLSIVKNVIDLHEGMYGVESEVGKGSNFWFKLPILSEDIKNDSVKDADFKELSK